MANKVRGDRVRDLRKALHLSQYDLSGELRRLNTEVAQSWISQIERNGGGLKGDSLAKLAFILGTSTDYLLGATDDPSPRESLENQVMLIEQDTERREHLQTIFNGVAKLPEGIRWQYYDAIEALYRGMAVKARTEKGLTSG
jgi:transcriptional regulator with XRE-family HTH domain